MYIVSPCPSVKPHFQRLSSNTTIDLRSGSERRIHVDRRKEERIGSVSDRRQPIDRRVK